MMQTVLLWSIPQENLGHWVSNELPLFITLPKVCHNVIAGGMMYVLCDSAGRTLGSLYLVPSGLHPPSPFSLCWFCFVSICCDKSYLWLQKKEKISFFFRSVVSANITSSTHGEASRSTSCQQEGYVEGEWVQGKTKNSWSLGSSWFVSLNPHNNLVEKWGLWIIKRLKYRTILGVLLSFFTNKGMEDQRAPLPPWDPMLWLGYLDSAQF